MNKTLTLAAAILALAAGPAYAQKAATAPAPAVAATPAPAPAAVGSAMRPGMWETTMTTQAAGSDSRRTVVSRTCYGATDVTDVARVLPRQREPGMKCENHEVKPQPGKASWQISCTSADTVLSGPAELSFAATSYTGKAELEKKKKGAKAEKVAATLSGKWIEACK